ncbi:MAG: hypothetical protein J6B56_00675 [Clostridia bacterium]|nr:hypothetical protein [Clostridia bacterium]
MEHFRSRQKAVAVFFAFVLAFVCYLFGWLFLLYPEKYASAESTASRYLSVKGSDFFVHSYGKVSNDYYIVIEYKGNESLPHNPQVFDNYALKVDGTEFCVYNESGAQMNLRHVTHRETPKTLYFWFYKKTSGDKLAYSDNINTLTIAKGARLGAQDATNYLGIDFTDGLTLVKTNGVWSVQATEEEKKETYEVELNASNVTLSRDMESGLPQATFELPFSREADATYESTLDVYLNGNVQEITAVQRAGEAQIRLSIENYVAPLHNEIPYIRIKGGDLTDSENNVIVSVTGDITFYEYVDGSWATEKYVQLKETVLGNTTERKLGVLDTYAFVRPQTETDKLYLGWTLENELVQEGNVIEIADYTKRTIETEAVFIGYGSIAGASIRYDQTGERTGIRFGAKLSTADFTAFQTHIQGVGMIVMPSNLLGAAEFTLNNYSQAGYAKNFFVPRENISFNGNYFTLYATISQVLLSNYNRAFCARAYVLTENGEYIWVSNIEKRSVYQVATAAMDAHKQNATLNTWQTDILETYINGVANIAYQNGVTQVVSSALSPVIEAAETKINGNFVTVTLITQKTSFSAITYNGKRVKNAQQNYENGVLKITFDETEAEE